MKRIFAFVFAALMLGLCACGGSGDGTQAPSDTDSSLIEPYYFETKGVKVAMNAEAAPVVAALGEPKNYVESPSCAFNGIDKEYNYGSYVIYTYPKDGVDYILQVVLMDDLCSTREGISIGAEKAQVTAAYGDECKVVGSGLEYDYGDCQLTFVFENDIVKSIQYYAVTGLN